jgi:hypothetical protein
MRVLMIAFTAAGLLLGLANTALVSRLFIGVLLLWIAWAAAGLGLSIAWLVRGPRLHALLPLAVIAAVAVSFPMLDSIGDDLSFRWRFRRERAEYERVVALVRAGNANPPTPLSVRIDGPRVAFPHDGIIDNWHGVVFDPTGPPTSRALFGGDLVSCKHVSGSFYRCWFT